MEFQSTFPIPNKNFWDKKKILLTGHNGFKGSWLSLILKRLGSQVYGYSLKPPNYPNLYDLLSEEDKIDCIVGDIRDYSLLSSYILDIQPEILIHMAAQPIVKRGYDEPIVTYETNVMGTVNVLEAVRNCPSIKIVVIVTTDKCYKNNEWIWGYRENDQIGGNDPYSNSKACAELVTDAYISSYFSNQQKSVKIVTVRAGNVIGGGDFSENRLIPDILRSMIYNDPLNIRSPQSTRPWQHVFDVLRGYLLLIEKMDGQEKYRPRAMNFGPPIYDNKPVEWIIERLFKYLGNPEHQVTYSTDSYKEASYLFLDSSKAFHELGWKPVYNIDETLEDIAFWIKNYIQGENISFLCKKDLDTYYSDKNVNKRRTN